MMMRIIKESKLQLLNFSFNLKQILIEIVNPTTCELHAVLVQIYDLRTKWKP
jgi:hypothetical protein